MSHGAAREAPLGSLLGVTAPSGPPAGFPHSCLLDRESDMVQYLSTIYKWFGLEWAGQSCLATLLQTYLVQLLVPQTALPNYDLTIDIER